VGDLSATFVELSWAGSASSDVAFYRIYRSTEMEARSMVIETKGPLLRVRDTNMTPGPRNYEIVAVDKEGNESPPTPPLKIIVP
jgi:fibronectin type 3 domain-containing protein